MQLRSSPPSPFGRKVKIVAKILGLYDKIEVVASNTNDPTDSLRVQNPLGKIPILVLDDGETLFDSRVIVEYLDSLTDSASVIPVEGKAKFAALKLQALADGLMDASILQVYESRFRPEEKRDADWMTYQAEKASRTLTVLNEAPPALDHITIGEITLACALSYLDLRFEGKWRDSYPALVSWLEEFAAKVPAFEQTTPQL